MNLKGNNSEATLHGHIQPKGWLKIDCKGEKEPCQNTKYIQLNNLGLSINKNHNNRSLIK